MLCVSFLLVWKTIGISINWYLVWSWMKWSCICHETLEKVNSIRNFMMKELFLFSSRVLLWAHELETKECSPVSEVKVCSLAGGLQCSETFVKIDSYQYWKNKGDKIARLICWLHEKVAFTLYKLYWHWANLFNFRSYAISGMW